MEGTEKMGTLLKKDKKLRMLLHSIAAILLGLTMIFPLLIMVSITLKPEASIFIKPLQLIPDQIYWGNYTVVLSNKYFPSWYGNTILIVIFTLLCRGFVVTLAAYAFARLKFRGRDALFLLALSGLMITSDTTIVARYLLYKYLGLIDTMWVIVLPGAFAVFFLFMMRQFFFSIPMELSEAALIDGCNHFKIYYAIILPLMKPALMTMTVFTLIWTWNEYTDAFIFITRIDRQMISVGLKYFADANGARIGAQMAGASFGIIPPILLFLFTQKYFVEGIASSGIKG